MFFKEPTEGEMSVVSESSAASLERCPGTIVGLEARLSANAAQTMSHSSFAKATERLHG